ncbi:MGDG synthase family glycosyltransferase [Alkalibacter saccharofermentans]|nr:glycosyltransferase [Alkalibacter saccharofermentans]
MILTTHFGAGHVSVSKAIQEHIRSIDANYRIHVVDTNELIFSRNSKIMYRSFDKIISADHHVYNFYYYHRRPWSFIHDRKDFFSSHLKKIDELLREMKPVCVLSSFPSSTELMSLYKDAYNSTIPLYTCITDVVDNDEWLHGKNDLYFVPHESIAIRLEQKGISRDKLIVTGIPVRKAFYSNYDKNALKEEFGYDSRNRIILIMGGALGIIPEKSSFYRWLNSIDHVRAVLISGKNSKLKEKVEELSLKNVKVIEYTDRMPEYMHMSDILIGKAGGITVFEAIVSLLPTIVYNPELGQEIENCKFIRQEGLGIITANTKELKKAIISMLYAENRDRIVDNLKKVRKSVNTRLIAEKILDTNRNEWGEKDD